MRGLNALERERERERDWVSAARFLRERDGCNWHKWGCCCWRVAPCCRPPRTLWWWTLDTAPNKLKHFKAPWPLTNGEFRPFRFKFPQSWEGRRKQRKARNRRESNIIKDSSMFSYIFSICPTLSWLSGEFRPEGPRLQFMYAILQEIRLSLCGACLCTTPQQPWMLPCFFWRESENSSPFNFWDMSWEQFCLSDQSVLIDESLWRNLRWKLC